jgi:predicted nuclease with TOPRIM domain
MPPKELFLKPASRPPTLKRNAIMTKKLKKNFNEIQSLLKQLKICKHEEVKLRSEAKQPRASIDDDENDEMMAMYMQLTESYDKLTKKYERLEKRYSKLKEKLSPI